LLSDHKTNNKIQATASYKGGKTETASSLQNSPSQPEIGIPSPPCYIFKPKTQSGAQDK
jgi:hypothetical protein